MEFLHNSHSDIYRSPFGALALGQGLHLALDVWDEDTDEGEWITEASLRLWREGQGEQLLPMQMTQLDGDVRRFWVDLPPEPQVGLLWYYFLLRTAGGELLFYGNNQRGLGGVGALSLDEPPSYQVTVYRPADVPEWFKSAICYQIFPDRFCRGEDWEECQRAASQPDWRGSARLVQQNWRDKPFYSYNEQGQVVRWPFFGGNLQGIRSKLLYLKSLGVSAIYLNPIFRATSNHKYDTADYRQIDPSFGTEEDFCRLAAEAECLGISLILDGVFNHTGEDSRYFNKFGNYPDKGAYQGEDSLYYSWYKFRNYPDDYACWWGVSALPEVDKADPAYRRFIFDGEDSVVRRWLRLGARGWRLDVADELPNDFIRGIRQAAREEKADALLLGEVWEDASNKRSYGEIRPYLLGDELDSVMNYPFRTAVLAYLLGDESAEVLAARLYSLKENYPPTHLASALNLLGTHDTPRVLTVLGEAPQQTDKTAAEYYTLPDDKLRLAKCRLKQMALLQFAMPGVPCIYYGDEAGVQGLADPFNRGTYPWGAQDDELLAWYKRLGHLRQEYPLLVGGDFQPLAVSDDVFACRRYHNPENNTENNAENNEQILVLFNRTPQKVQITLPLTDDVTWARELLTGQEKQFLSTTDDELTHKLPPYAAQVWLLRKSAPQPLDIPRAAGVLCHVTSLPPSDGGWPESCRHFIDYLSMAGQKLWQVLPLNPVGPSGSPYTPYSVFAGQEDLAGELWRNTDWRSVPSREYLQFCYDNAYWLDDYVLFMAIRRERSQMAWQRWPKAERDRLDLPKLRAQYAEGMEEYRRRQFLFHTEWAAVKAYANSRGISIIGDVPIYTAADSADVWAHRELFLLDDFGYPLLGAGVPPDYFAKKGQNWGNPLYNWQKMSENDYRWWQQRFGRARQLYDYLRVDHFRAFSAYYAVPQVQNSVKEIDTSNGCWLKGPGHDFFRRIEAELGSLPLLAEDLGLLDDEVRNLLRLTAYPGMAVYQFEENLLEDTAENAAYLQNRVLYTGTHDNQTLQSWLLNKGGVPAAESALKLIGGLYQTAAPWVIIPLQDMFGLDDSARMNIPGQAEGNWRWQADWQDFKLTVAAQFGKMAKQSGR